MTSTLDSEKSTPVHDGPAAAAEGPVFADPELQAIYDAAEPMPGDE